MLMKFGSTELTFSLTFHAKLFRFTYTRDSATFACFFQYFISALYY